MDVLRRKGCQSQRSLGALFARCPPTNAQRNLISPSVALSLATASKYCTRESCFRIHAREMQYSLCPSSQKLPDKVSRKRDGLVNGTAAKRRDARSKNKKENEKKKKAEINERLTKRLDGSKRKMSTS